MNFIAALFTLAPNYNTDVIKEKKNIKNHKIHKTLE